MGHVFLIHWKQDEVASFSEPLRDAGWRVDTEHDDVEAAVRGVNDLTPDAVVLSLRRDAARGRRFAEMLARDGIGEGLPILAVDGEEDDVAAVQEALPNVTAVDWTELPATLRDLLDRPAS